MIIWGGWDDQDFLNTGGSYNPGTDSWIATSMTNVPTGRFQHSAVWTGSEMIVWGGWNPELFQHRRQIRSRYEQLDTHQHNQRALGTQLSHGSLDRQ